LHAAPRAPRDGRLLSRDSARLAVGVVETEASRRRWRTKATETKNAAAMSSSDWPFSRRARKARNWSSGCSG
jgi:hypothetical protein